MYKRFLKGTGIVLAVSLLASCANFLKGGSEIKQKIETAIENSQAAEFYVDVRVNSTNDGRITVSPAGGVVYDNIPFRVSFELNREAGYFDCWKVYRTENSGLVEFTEAWVEDYYHGEKKYSDVLKIDEIETSNNSNVYSADITMSRDLGSFSGIVIVPQIKDTVWNITPPEEGELSPSGEFHFRPGNVFEIKYSSSKYVLYGWEVLNAAGETLCKTDDSKLFLNYCDYYDGPDNKGKKPEMRLFEITYESIANAGTVVSKFLTPEKWYVWEKTESDGNISLKEIESGYVDIDGFTLIPLLRKKPALLMSTPSDKENSVAKDSSLELVFSEPMGLYGEDISILIIENPGKADMTRNEKGTEFYNILENYYGKSVVEIKLKDGKTLPSDSVVSVTVSGAAKSLSGIPLGEDQTFTFRTKAD